MLILSVFCYIIRAINYVFVVLKVMLYMSDRLIDNKELMKEWNQEKNILYNPADLTSGSSKKVWWKCKNGHEYIYDGEYLTCKNCGYYDGKEVISKKETENA